MIVTNNFLFVIVVSQLIFQLGISHKTGSDFMNVFSSLSLIVQLGTSVETRKLDGLHYIWGHFERESPEILYVHSLNKISFTFPSSIFSFIYSDIAFTIMWNWINSRLNNFKILVLWVQEVCEQGLYAVKRLGVYQGSSSGAIKYLIYYSLLCYYFLNIHFYERFILIINLFYNRYL
jgi:hypothetical protein